MVMLSTRTAALSLLMFRDDDVRARGDPTLAGAYSKQFRFLPVGERVLPQSGGHGNSEGSEFFRN